MSNLPLNFSISENNHDSIECLSIYILRLLQFLCISTNQVCMEEIILLQNPESPSWRVKASDMYHLGFGMVILVKSVSQEPIRQLPESLTISSQRSIAYLSEIIMNKLVVMLLLSLPEVSLLT